MRIDFIYFISIRSWGDWFNCLHVRMGLPNWLLVSTVSLGVIFTLWLCLVIPSNPPKQKVKAARVPKNVNVKELEANGHIATIIMPPPAADLEKVKRWTWEGNQTTYLKFLKLICAYCRKIGTEESLIQLWLCFQAIIYSHYIPVSKVSWAGKFDLVDRVIF